MASPVSAKLQHGKKAKFEKELERLLQDFPAKSLNSYLQEMFETTNPPNVRRFIKMISSAKFGGENHWTSVDAGPRLIFELINAVWPQFKLNFQKNFEDLDGLKDPISFNYISKKPIGYLLSYVVFFPNIGKHIENISISDFNGQMKYHPFYI